MIVLEVVLIALAVAMIAFWLADLLGRDHAQGGPVDLVGERPKLYDQDADDA